MNDPFKILGLNPGASEEEIKKAYKKLALEHHPDRHPEDKNAEEKFKEISGAYEALKNNNWQQHQNSFDFNGFPGFGFSFDDIFNQAFGQNPFRNANRVKKGRMSITLEEAYNGCTKKINVGETENCNSCKGLGYNLSDKNCSTCGGTGQRRVSQGAISMISSCNSCKGLGKQIGNRCKECNGKGKKESNEEITINIPPGILNGAKLKPSNNLQIQILYAPHKEYKTIQNSLNIISQKEIDLFTALLGGSISVNTLGGVKKVKIPASCQPETILRIKEAGMRLSERYGDHLLQVKVKLPTSLTEEQKGLLQKIQNLEEKND